MSCDNPVLPFGCLAGLAGVVIAVAVWKRWTYGVLIAAIAAALSEFAWATQCVGPNVLTEARVMFLLTQALFLGVQLGLTRSGLRDRCTVAAALIAGAAPLVALLHNLSVIDCSRDSGFATILLSAAGLIALAVIVRRGKSGFISAPVIVAIALALTWKAEWSWYRDVFGHEGLDDRSLMCTTEFNQDDARNLLVVLLYAIFFLFARTPYLFGTKRHSFWIMSALAGPPRLWLVYQVIEPDFYPEWFWLLPIGFALPAATGIWHLVRNEGVRFASRDPRLVSQSLALLRFVGVALPLQLRATTASRVTSGEVEAQ